LKFKERIKIVASFSQDKRSHLSQKLSRVEIKKYGMVHTERCTHEGDLTKQQYDDLCKELNDIVAAHTGPGFVVRLIAQIGNDNVWINLLEPKHASMAA
jgi:hypothetical protein